MGYADWGQLVLAPGFFSWLAIESVLLHRLLTAQPLLLALRPTLGIQVASPTVGALEYLNVTHCAPDMLVHAMTGYGLLQALIAIRLWPWPVSSCCARILGFLVRNYGVGNGSTAIDRAWRWRGRSVSGSDAFGIANVVVAALLAGTIRLFLQHRLLPAPAGPTAT